MRTEFDAQLRELGREVGAMGALCEEAIGAAAHAVANGDLTRAGDLPALAARIKHKERDIESRCMRLLLRQQPIAHDLRSVSAALKMVTDMERIGDQSADIGDILLAAKLTDAREAGPIAAMAEGVIAMVTGSVEAFAKQDAAGAARVIEMDDVVDEAFCTIKNTLISAVNRSLANGERALDLLMIAKYFERIGDHAVNIARWVLFSINGPEKPDVDDLIYDAKTVRENTQ